MITSPHVNGHYPETRGMLRSLNDTHLGCIAPLVIPQQGSLDQVSVRQVYTETKCVCVYRTSVIRTFMKFPGGTFVRHLFGT